MVQTRQQVLASEEFLTRVNRLANYVKRAKERNKAAILFALFKVETTRLFAERSLTGILEGGGFRILRVDLNDPKNSDLVTILLRAQESPNDVFFVYGLRAVNQPALRSLNIRRELLLHEGVKVVFWLEESQLQGVAFGAHDFWAFRHRIVEFIELPEEETLHKAAEKLLHDTDYTSRNELLAKIQLRQDLLRSLGKGATYERARMHFELGQLLYHNGELAKAKKHLQQALEVVSKLKGKPERAAICHQLGMIAQDQGDYEEARKLYQQSLKIEERLGNQGGIAVSSVQLSLLHLRLSELEEALRLIQKAEAIFERLGDRSSLVKAREQRQGIEKTLSRRFTEVKK